MNCKKSSLAQDLLNIFGKWLCRYMWYFMPPDLQSFRGVFLHQKTMRKKTAYSFRGNIPAITGQKLEKNDSNKMWDVIRCAGWNQAVEPRNLLLPSQLASALGDHVGFSGNGTPKVIQHSNLHQTQMMIPWEFGDATCLKSDYHQDWTPVTKKLPGAPEGFCHEKPQNITKQVLLDHTPL